MAQQKIQDPSSDRMRRSVLGILLLTVFLATLAIFIGAYRYFERIETQTAANQMEHYLRSLNRTLGQHQHLPFVLANDPRYLTALETSERDQSTNDRLLALAQQADLEAIYLMDESGQVVATSNAQEPHSFLNQKYGFRPYFQDALKGARSDYFAIGATSGRPGYFVAEPVMSQNAAPVGVIAIKLDMSELQQSWESDTETVVATDKNDIVVLASNPDWLYHSINDLSPDIRSLIVESRQFGTMPLDRLAWTQEGEGRVSVDDQIYLKASGLSDWHDWRVHYLQPQGLVLRQTLQTTALFGSAIALLVGFATYLRSRRIGLAYAASLRQRSELMAANRQLKHAQNELARSAKLAALGNVAASVTHELGQPISAFRNHLVAAEMSNEITSPTTASNLNKLVDRMEAITRQFKYFVRGRAEQKEAVSLAQILVEAEALLKDDIKAAGIDFHPAHAPADLMLRGHKVQLEQTFINLIKNAIQALDETANPRIIVSCETGLKDVEIRVQDNGPGLANSSLSDLQEPFFSTKPSGVGMGLGLAIAAEIIKDHGGDLALGSVEQGAEFVVTLPLFQESELT